MKFLLFILAFFLVWSLLFARVSVTRRDGLSIQWPSLGEVIKRFRK